MNVNQIIEHALEGITSDLWPLVCPDERPPDEYLVYNPEIELPEDFGDNRPSIWVAHIQVHLYTKKDFTETKKQIRHALQQAGFIMSDITTMYERDTRYYHVCFSCSIEERED